MLQVGDVSQGLFLIATMDLPVRRILPKSKMDREPSA